MADSVRLTESEQSKLDRILVLVQSGTSITDAVVQENCYNWFYRKLTTKHRAFIVAARREFEQTKADQSSLNKKRNRKAQGTHTISLEIPCDRKIEFQQQCDNKGVSMNAQINQLITAFILSNR